MKDYLTYKNIVSGLVFITIWVILFIVASNCKNHIPVNRYQLFKDNDNTILLDKQTGLTWRNVWNNNKDKIPSDWELMNQYGDYTDIPIGEQQRRDNMIKRTIKQMEKSKNLKK